MKEIDWDRIIRLMAGLKEAERRSIERMKQKAHSQGRDKANASGPCVILKIPDNPHESKENT